MTKGKRKREPYFEIRGYVADSDQALCAMAMGEHEAGRLIGHLLKKRKVLFVEILRFNSPKTTEAEIRNSIGRWPYTTPLDGGHGLRMPDQRTIH
jgi:hypothetical protein